MARGTDTSGDLHGTRFETEAVSLTSCDRSDVLEIVLDQVACRGLKRVVIRRLHPQGNGHGWEVERFEPPLPTPSEEIARHVMDGCRTRSRWVAPEEIRPPSLSGSTSSAARSHCWLT
jgi:hypothetical protein